MAVLAFPTRSARPPSMRSSVRLGMAHVAPGGLSEQWLLRECGDRHWSLIAEAMGQDRAVFTTADGRPIYAAFCTTELEVMPFAKPLLGADLAILSELYTVSAGRLGSLNRFFVDGEEIARLSMISTFVSHDGSGSNRRILRSRPAREAELATAPASLCALSERSRDIARALRDRTATSAPILRALPCVALDFNAVGLLYFPTFSKLAELADWQTKTESRGLARRTVVYLGNIDVGESLAMHSAADGLDIVRADGKIIAHVQTRRHGRESRVNSVSPQKFADR